MSEPHVCYEDLFGHSEKLIVKSIKSEAVCAPNVPCTEA